MKVNRKAGTCNSWQEMDIESRQAVYLAERLVENKRGVVVGKEHIGSCTLEVCYGCNISNTHYRYSGSLWTDSSFLLQRLFLR